MNRAQKHALAMAVISRAADLAEVWEETVDIDPALEGIDFREAMQTIANWLGRLPGDRWDTRLPLPDNATARN